MMKNKIITKMDANYITVSREEISQKAIAQNELLIRDLVTRLQDPDHQLVTVDKQLNDEVLKKRVMTIVDQLDLEQIEDVILVVDYLTKQVEVNRTKISNQQTEIDSYQVREEQSTQLQIATEGYLEKVRDKVSQMQIELDKLNLELETVIAERDKYKQKYEGQKNRKIIKMIDKVVKN